jgi:hypothetical protein
LPLRNALVVALTLLLCACLPTRYRSDAGSLDASEDVADSQVYASDHRATDASRDGVADTSVDRGGGDTADGAPSEAAREGSRDGAADASVPPDASRGICGDGQRDPATEECDDGLMTSDPARRSCSAQCRVLDELAVLQVDDAGAVSNSPRRLGAGRHPISSSDSTYGIVYVEPDSNPLTLSLATFASRGAATGIINAFSTRSAVVDSSYPVLAGLPGDRYAVAWAQYDVEGGGDLDIALSVVDPRTPPAAPPGQANTTTLLSQFDPDIVWTGSQLVVAWVDTSNEATEPDIRYRTFDSNLNPASDEQALADTADSEADVALATFAGSWAAAWRDDANGLETIQVRAGPTTWTVGPSFLPPPVSSKPALTALDSSHLLVVYAVGVDDTGSGVANGSQILAALLDAAAESPVTGTPIAQSNLSGVDQSAPAAATVQGNVFIAWQTSGVAGDPNGEELWLKSIGWNGSTLDLSSPEIPLPRWPGARVGDQEAPALASKSLSPGGALATAWNDFGRATAAGEGNGDVVTELIPLPLLRLPGDGGP